MVSSIVSPFKGRFELRPKQPDRENAMRLLVLDSLSTDPAMGTSTIAFVSAGPSASTPGCLRASVIGRAPAGRGTQRVILAVCRNLAKLARDDCGILLHARRNQRQSPIQRLLQ
jgi:hypothetical protein